MRSKRLVLPAVLGSLLLGLALPSPVAGAGPAMVLVASDEGLGPGWIAFHVHQSGYQQVRVRLVMEGSYGYMVTSVPLGMDDKPLYNYLDGQTPVGAGFVRSDGGAYVQLSMPLGLGGDLGQQHEDRLLRNEEPTRRLEIDYTLNRPENQAIEGDFKIAFWAAGAVESWSYEIAGEPGVSIAGQTSGSSTYYVTAEDFRGTFHAEASAGVPGTSPVVAGYPGGRATVGTSYVIDVQHAFFGSFLTAPYAFVSKAHVERADGRTYECDGSCTWPAPEPVEDAVMPLGTGPVTFHLDAVVGGPTNFLGDTTLMGADILLPE